MFQMQVLSRENSRLVAENNQLHVDIMSAIEAAKGKEREHYQSAKALECQIAELAYWKNCTLKKLKELEADNQGLRSKMQETLKNGFKETGVMDMTASLDLNCEPETATETTPEASQKGTEVDIVRAADARLIRALSTIIHMQLAGSHSWSGRMLTVNGRVKRCEKRTHICWST